MKKLTLFCLLATAAAFAQQPGYTNTVSATVGTTDYVEGTLIRHDNGRQPIIDTYTELVEFNNDVTANCQDPTLISEDMAGGPAAIQGCGNIISSAGDGCFAPGELEDGFTAEATNAGDMVYIPAGAIGNTDDLVGASAFAESTIIRFQIPVYAVAFDLWENNEPITIIRIYGADDTLIETYDADTPTNQQTFFGFIADEVITRVDVEGQAGSGELFGNFLFGADCGATAGVDEFALSQVSLFPNPATSTVTIKTPGHVSVQNVTITDVLGKTSTVAVVNGSIDVSGLARGLYMVSIETSAGTRVQKLIKQ
ncbi:MAG: T9SS type A sorting domain-containing protein [Marinirhabdus sp.]|nr:T9SS type A sorting domain-containing protein [Marinirhabdus sp.]